VAVVLEDGIGRVVVAPIVVLVVVGEVTVAVTSGGTDATNVLDGV